MFGLILRVTHTGLSKSSIFISDLDDGVRDLYSFRKPGPVYVPYLQTVDITYASSVAKSFEVGGIRGFINRGHLTAVFVFGPALAPLISALDRKVSATSADTVPGSLTDKISFAADTPLTVSVTNPGANEGYRLSLDGDQVDIDFTPSNYIPTLTGTASDTQDLAAHLKGIDDYLGSTISAAKVRDYVLTGDFQVPAAGTLYLKFGSIFTSSTPLLVNKSLSLRGAALRVDLADISRTYELQVLRNGTVSETLTLTPGNVSVYTNVFTTAFIPGDEISARLVRMAGLGKSSFANIVASLELLET